MCWQSNTLRSKECVYWRDQTNDQTAKPATTAQWTVSRELVPSPDSFTVRFAACSGNKWTREQSPNRVACLNANKEWSPRQNSWNRKQLKHTNEGSVEQTVVTREPAGSGRSTSQLWQEYIAAWAMRHSPSCEQGFTVPARQNDGEGR